MEETQTPHSMPPIQNVADKKHGGISLNDVWPTFDVHDR